MHCAVYLWIYYWIGCNKLLKIAKHKISNTDILTIIYKEILVCSSSQIIKNSKVKQRRNVGKQNEILECYKSIWF